MSNDNPFHFLPGDLYGPFEAGTVENEAATYGALQYWVNKSEENARQSGNIKYIVIVGGIAILAFAALAMKGK